MNQQKEVGFRVYWDGYLEVPLGDVLDMKEYSPNRFLWLGTAFLSMRSDLTIFQIAVLVLSRLSRKWSVLPLS